MPKRHRFLALIALAFLLTAPILLASEQAPPELERLPTCDDPALLGPIQPTGASETQAFQAVAWNGHVFGVAWTEAQSVGFRLFYADGTPASGIQTVASGFTVSQFPTLVWDGNQFGLDWTQDSGGGILQTYFARIDGTGATIGGPTRISEPGGETSDCIFVDVASNGGGFFVIWSFMGGTSYDIRAAILGSDGSVVVPDFLVNTVATANLQWYPSASWSAASSAYSAAWSSYHSGTHWELSRSLLRTDGSSAGSTASYVSDLGDSDLPSVAASVTNVGLAWRDTRVNPSGDVYFKLSGNPVTEVQLTNSVSEPEDIQLVWTGAEFNIFWAEDRGSGSEIWMQRLDGAGNPLAGEQQLTVTGSARRPAAAFAEFGYLLTLTPDFSAAGFQAPLGCQADWTPPSCPGNLFAYSITGTTATISWLPSVEDASDLAYYEVYRNNSLVGTTAETLYADSGLSVDSTYSYSVRPRNAAALVNGDCSDAIFIKTSASLKLQLSKSDHDAHLFWNDEAIPVYRVFRGTSAQVMSEIGATPGFEHDDPLVLLDGVTYYYTVDDPGW